jgi:hypothetical protein
MAGRGEEGRRGNAWKEEIRGRIELKERRK